MLGQPVSMLIPKVVGFRLTGEMAPGTTATDLVLTVTEMLRKHGVVGKFVEFYGEGVAAVPLADRATIGNMSPEYGSTCAIFPIDAETLSLPAASPGAPPNSSRWSRPMPRSRACGTTRPTSPASPRRWSSTSPPSSLRWPGRSARRTGCRCGWPKPASGRPCARSPRRRNPTGCDEASEESFPASDPAAAFAQKQSDRPVVSANVGEVGDRPSVPTHVRLEEGTRPNSTTARWSSRRSRAAPTRRTRRSWSAPACLRRTQSSGG